MEPCLELLALTAIYTEALMATRLIQNVTGSHCISSGLAFNSTEDSSAWGKAESFRSIQPFREKETQTPGTPVSLYEEIQSGHIMGEKDLEKLDSF